MRVLPPEKREAILRYLDEGHGMRAISRLVGVTLNTVRRYHRNPETHLFVPRPYVRRNARALAQQETPRLCACGCGQITRFYNGRAAKWIQGHVSTARAKQLKLLRPDHETDTEKHQRRDAMRAKLGAALYHDRTLTRDDLFERFKNQGFVPCALGVLIRSTIRDHSFGLNTDALVTPPRRKVYAKPQEPYKRRLIPYEAATDISYLSRLPHFAALDALGLNGQGSALHERVPSLSMDPAEAMMWAEEQTEQEGLSQDRRRYREWEERGRGLVSVGELLQQKLGT